MKLEWREIWFNVSSITSLVSPLAGAGATGGRGVAADLLGSELRSVVVRRGEALEGVPGVGVNTPFLTEERGIGGARRSMVKARKSSCCNLRCDRIVSNIVDIVRRDRFRIAGLSDRANWKRYLQLWSITSVIKEGKSPIRGPATSNMVLRIPKAVKRVESVCIWSAGSKMLMITRKSSRIDGSPSRKISM
jgi:hypothetical protein